MTEFQEKASVVSCEPLSTDIILLKLLAPRIANNARPGQFVMVRVFETADPLLRRPFSVHHTSPTTGIIYLLLKIVGKGTRLLSDLKPGDLLDLIGPLGNGFDLSNTKSVCLIGGGMGIAPLFFLADWIYRNEKYSSEVNIFLGAQSADELIKIADKFYKLPCKVLCATDDGSLGHHGFVTELLKDALNATTRVYSCGPWQMMRIVAEMCIQQNLFCEVSLEAHMACGLGACLGCTTVAHDGTYRHVCKQGPVFQAKEMSWKQ